MLAGQVCLYQTITAVYEDVETSFDAESDSEIFGNLLQAGSSELQTASVFLRQHPGILLSYLKDVHHLSIQSSVLPVPSPAIRKHHFPQPVDPRY